MSSTQAAPRKREALTRRASAWFCRQFHCWSTSSARRSRKLSSRAASSCSCLSRASIIPWSPSACSTLPTPVVRSDGDAAAVDPVKNETRGGDAGISARLVYLTRTALHSVGSPPTPLAAATPGLPLLPASDSYAPCSG